MTKMKRQQGIALITILMMVALATIIAATIAKRQSNTNESTAYLMRQNQAMYYAKSAEAFFSELLVQDTETDAAVDYLQENWAKPMPAFPVDGGIISGQIIDESGKFNLNSLLNETGQPNNEAKILFENLLKRLNLNPELSQAVIDWQDPDDLTIGPMGAESNYYSGLPEPYLAANTIFHHKEELKQVRGFEAKQYELIAPYITAIPNIGSKININTVPAIVLAAIDERLDVNSIQNLLNSKQTKMEYFINTNAMWSNAPFDRIDPANKKIAESLFDVKSIFFQAQIEVLLSERKRQFTSYLMRSNGKVYIYSRSLAPY